MDDKLKANDQLAAALKSIFAVAENYPQLKASDNFKELQEQLEGTEDKISYVQDIVQRLRSRLQQLPADVPGQLLRQCLRIQAGDFFAAPPGQSEPVKVDFSGLNDDA